MLIQRFTNHFFNLHFTIVICICVVLFTSCKTTQIGNGSYFKNLQKDTSFRNTGTAHTESKITKKDQLAIIIASSSREEDVIYNAPSGGGATGMLTGGSSAGGGYWVDANGNIQLHKIGIIHAEGMTRRELKDKIQKDLLPYLKDPIVSVQYMNRKVTVMGEIKAPKIIPMPEEELTILDALAAGGDVTEFARRDNILLIRETESGKQAQHINLEDKSIFTSPWYYLQPGDVLYVSPNDEREKQAKRAMRQQNFSVIISAVSLAVIILDRVIR